MLRQVYTSFYIFYQHIVHVELVYHQQIGDCKEILRLSSRPCYPSLTFEMLAIVDVNSLIEMSYSSLDPHFLTLYM